MELGRSLPGDMGLGLGLDVEIVRTQERVDDWPSVAIWLSLGPLGSEPFLTAAMRDNGSHLSWR